MRALHAFLLVCSSTLVACGGAAPRSTFAASSNTAVADAHARIDALRQRDPRPALEAALEGVDPNDPIAVLSAVDPLLEFGVPADDHLPALLVAAVASAELGLPWVVNARLSEVVESDAGEARSVAIAMIAGGLAGAATLWQDYVQRLTPTEVDDAISGAPPPRRRDLRLTLANAYQEMGFWAEALRLLAVPALDGDPEARWSRALCRLALEDAAAARPDLEFAVASESEWSEPARVLLTRYRILEASDVRMTVYDSPHFHGDAAHAVLGDALGPLETIAPTSRAYLAAIEARTMILYWSEREDEAVALWLSVPAERRVFAMPRFSRVAAWDALEADPSGACSTYLAAQAAVARTEAWISALPEEPGPDACSRVASLPQETADALVPFVTAYHDPIDAAAWRLADPLGSLLARERVVVESSARLAELPEAFRASHAGQRAAQDLFVALEFFHWTCTETARAALGRAEDRARLVGEDLVALGLDPTRCGPGLRKGS